MKILLLSHKFDPDIGGIEINSEVLADQFSRSGHEVRVVTWSTGASSKPFAYQVTRGPGVGELFRNHFWADVVFENNPCLKLSWPSLVLKKPLVIALNTWISRSDGRFTLRDKIKTWWLGRSSSVIAVSRALSVRNWPHAIVIGNPYNSRLFRTMTDAPKVRDFVFLGRLVSDKGADQAIRAIAALNRDGDVTPSLTIIGDGPEKSHLNQLISDLGMRHRVELTGALRGEELVKLLNQHRFIVVPSLWEEPFGNVVLEGMACGCVPIVSNGGGLPDAVGKAGVIFERGDLNALVKAMRDIVRDKKLEGTLRCAGKAHLATHQPEVIAKRYLEVLRSALSK